MTRVLIIGSPCTGKTTMAEKMGNNRSTDQLMHLGWSGCSEAVTKWLDETAYGVLEGVAIPRALRKWREANPGKPPPVDKIIYLTTPYIPHTKGQASMAKGMDTVMDEIREWLSSVESETI